MNSNWSVEAYLTTPVKLIAKDGKRTGEYFIKLRIGKLSEHGYPVIGVYTPVKDGALLIMMITFKMEGVKENGLV